MNKIACFRLSLFATLAVLLSGPADSFSQTQSSSQAPSARPVPPTAVRGSRHVAPAQSDAKSASPDQPLGNDTLYNCGNPTNEEQYQLELMNRARANPDSEGIRLEFDTTAQVVIDYSYFAKQQNYFAPTPKQVDSSFAPYPARPPMAFNADLCRAARGHDTVMLMVDAQYHYIDTSKYHGIDGGAGGPQTRIDSQGYSNWSNWGENVYDYGNGMDDILAAFLVDWGNSDLAHRHNIMSFDPGDAIWNEVGVGILHGSDSAGVGPILITEDFGRRMIDNFFTAPYTFVLGVVYTDANQNGLYDMGEGDSGVTITLSSGSTYYAITTGSGGYAIPFTGSALTLLTPVNGASLKNTAAFTWENTLTSITVTASGGPFANPVIQTVQLNGVNVKVDFKEPFSSPSTPEVTNYLLLVSKSANLSTPYVVNDTLEGTITTATPSPSSFQPDSTYYWEVLAKNDQGWGAPSAIWSFKAPAASSVGEPLTVQTATSVSPNPTAGESHIRFTLSTDADVSLRVFNTLGEEVQSLALGHLSPSSYNYALEVSKLPSGSYTYQLREGDQTETGRIVKW